jgi:glutathione S-transferase
MDYVALVIVLAIIQYFFFVAMVGKARGKYSINAPATTGDKNFERVFRVQQNTLEQLIIFIPSLYLFALYVHALAAAGIGLFFLMGRAIYYKSYINDPSTRTVGMALGVFSYAILTIGALIGIVLNIV